MPGNLCSGGHGRVPVGSDVHAVGTRGGLRIFLESGDKGKLALAPAQLTSNRQAHLRAEHKRYSRHSFRVGAAANHHMDGTAMDVLLEYVGWRSVAVASRYVGMTASASAPNGTERSRDTAFIQADA